MALPIKGEVTQEVSGPGNLTSSLLNALKALHEYAQTAGEINPQDEDVALVRQIIQAITKLVAKDQQENQGGQMGMGGGQAGMMGGGMMGGEGLLAGAPMMPSLEGLDRIG